MSLRTLLLPVFLLIINTLYAFPYFYIKVETPSVWTAEFSLMNAQNEFRSYKIDLRQTTNDASFTLDVEAAKFVTLTYAGESYDVFVEPEDDLKIIFRDKQIAQTIRFEGKGAVNNTVLSTFLRRFRSEAVVDVKSKFLTPTIDKNTESRALSSDETTYLSLVNADKEAALQFLDEAKPKIHKKVYSHLWKELNYLHDAQLYAYFILKNMSADEFRLTTQKFFPFKGFNYADYERNETTTFRNALKTFVHYQAEQFQNNDDPNTLFETIEKKLEGYDRFWLEKELLLEVLDKTGSHTFGQQHIDQFRKNCNFADLVREVDEAYERFSNITERAEAPDLQMVTIDGAPVYLKDFRGKVVYISFWASWCQPCIVNFIKYAEVRNRLSTEGVVLLNVSIDEQPDQFRSAVARLGLRGLNVQPMDITATKKLYNLYTIPSYFIVDKQGKFMHLSDKEGRDVIGEFKKLLTE
jgi:thiol-disulfide isomerase/thioredoxin